MKFVLLLVALFSTLEAVAAPLPGIICREDNRLNNGSLRELILTPEDGGYLLQSQFVPTLHSPDIVIENLAAKLTCKIDDKLAYCTNENNQNVVQIKERREVYYDSLEEDVKKKTTKNTDISVTENGVDKRIASFAASHCQAFGDEA